MADRLISADALLCVLGKEYFPASAEFARAMNIARFAIQYAPTIDPAPVKRGRWEWNGNHWECSSCRGNRFHDLVLGLDANYCGYCGARMDGEE